MDRVANSKIRKRKAESQDNERLHKRLSLLNLERNGEKLYVPVEHPAPNTTKPKSPAQRPTRDDDMMQLDDTKHKVYIYDLDAELSDSESSDDGKLVFLPDIQKHLLETRIPPMVLANSDGELAGNNQLVLYNIPSSLTVPEEQDSVRKAIIETRARARAAQEQRQNEEARQTELKKTSNAQDWYRHVEKGGNTSQAPSSGFPTLEPMDGEPTVPMIQGPLDDDPDAMDLG
ncbi:hypothetical protein ONS95_012419 [Cadophora gregata]|uniref:uncharacterized protein n=1 Tax=Cadophora gregata TaxID=51156 RepID=UPI0026DCBD53|nr:uncharacterized protein ONS95_012419 [Cadophora gregata]KAK0118113.1 hypothetical protein ONS95_012419 [Cadophora gregata]KAK0123183.1 hypothetical protein ONS96_010184 [Cadophora gregata f. sp. sojae]